MADISLVIDHLCDICQGQHQIATKTLLRFEDNSRVFTKFFDFLSLYVVKLGNESSAQMDGNAKIIFSVASSALASEKRIAALKP